MFNRQTKSAVDSLVGVSARIEGELRFTGGLRIDGEVHGNVVAMGGADSVLIVSEQARITGEVRCASLIVNGYISGTVYSSEMLELQAKGRIDGDVVYRLLEMHGGAMVTGKLTHQPHGEPDGAPFSGAFGEPIFDMSELTTGAAA